MKPQTVEVTHTMQKMFLPGLWCIAPVSMETFKPFASDYPGIWGIGEEEKEESFTMNCIEG